MKTRPETIQFLLVGLVFCVLGVGCSQHSRFISPKVELLNLNVKDVSFSHINYQAKIRLYNPNLEALKVDYMQYSLYINGIKLVDGAEQVSEEIGPHKEAVIPVRLSGSVLNVIRLISNMQNAKEVDFEMKGTVSGIDTNGHYFSLPFSEKGKLDLSSLNPGLPLQ